MCILSYTQPPIEKHTRKKETQNTTDKRKQQDEDQFR